MTVFFQICGGLFVAGIGLALIAEAWCRLRSWFNHRVDMSSVKRGSAMLLMLAPRFNDPDEADFRAGWEAAGRLLAAKRFITALESRIRELEGALGPFAQEAVNWHTDWSDSTVVYAGTYADVHEGQTAKASFTVGDLRRAARTLKGGA